MMENQTEDFLKKFHERFPGCTSACMATGKTETGRSSYEILAAQVKAPGVVLDLACGDGFLLSLMPAALRRIGLDMSEAELALAARRPDLELILGNGRQLPLPGSSVDYVTCHMAFMLMEGVRAVANEILRVLKPGGIFAAVIPHPAPLDFQPDDALKTYLALRSDALAEEGLRPAKIGDPATKSVEGVEGLLAGFARTEFQELTVNYEMNLEETVRYFSLLYTPGQLSAAAFERFKDRLRREFSRMPQPIVTRLPILCWSALK